MQEVLAAGVPDRPFGQVVHLAVDRNPAVVGLAVLVQLLERDEWARLHARGAELLAGARLAVVEHYLLLAPGRERFLFDRCDCVLFLDPGVDADGAAARATCRERRACRTAGRPDAELAHLRAYYDAHVWPAFERYTLAPFRALPGECKATLDARRPPAAVLADALAAVAKFRAR